METESLPEAMLRISDQAVAYVHNRFDLELDYSEESLQALEELLAAFSNHLSEFRPAFVDQITLGLGAYLGEVIRRHWGGTWTQETPLGEATALRIGQHYLFPTGKVQKRLFQGEADSITFYYQAFRSVVDAEGIDTSRQ